MYHLVDFHTKKRISPKNFVFTGENGPWEVVMDLDTIRRRINIDYFRQAPPCLAKYLPLLPLKDHTQFISLKETATPLVKSKNLNKKLGLDLYFKIEAKNPTGSFKDRGSAIDVSIAKELGAQAIVLASTGNMAASCACYAAAAQIPCFVFVPEGVPMAKLAQVMAFGGRIVQVKGSYNDAARLAQTIAEEKGFYLAGDYAFRVEGQKTAAFELLDQLLFDEPDMVVVPIGCGTNITAYAKGFKEYRELGLIAKTPQLIGVQAEGAAAVVNSFKDRLSTIEPHHGVNTVASAIAIGDPIDGVKALDAIYSTFGQALAVSDQEMLEAQYLLSTEEGLFVENSSAATLAAVIKMSTFESLKGKKIVCILTGEGLKDPSVILKVAIKPPTLYPSSQEFTSLYDAGFFENKNVLFIDKDLPLFSQEPTLDEIKLKLKELFQAQYDQEYIETIEKILSACLRKGKTVTVADLQDIIQDALEMLRHKSKKIFCVLDFGVTTGKDRIAKAWVKVDFKGKERVSEAEGVGPFDAIVKALTEACDGRIDFALKDYKVDIRNQGVDAVVYVELKLQRDHQISLGRATSPDIIQASVEAFEEAYNGLRIT
jgi:threonine synthase